jgi:hypothetical protein
MATTLLSNKNPGELVKIKESGVLQDFYVAKQGYPTAGNGRTLLVRRYIYDTRQWHSSNVNAYATSTIDAWCNGDYFNSLPADIRGEIAAVSIPYTPGNGDTTLSSLSRKVFLLSATELGQTSTYLNAEGTALANAATLKIATDSGGTAKVQWTRSPYTSLTSSAWLLNTNGSLSVGNCTSAYGARPAFTLPSSLSVADDGGVTVNTPPVINYSGGTNLGDKNADFTVSYSVSDAESDAVTVTEKLDGTTKRTLTPALGQAQTFQAVIAANFQTVLNGDHTLTIEATDGKAAATPVNITFSKKVYAASITLTSPLAASAMPTAIRLSITGQIPADAVWTAEVCNNANDASPTWENIKPAVVAGNNYVFQNASKTDANWGVNFRINAQRGSGNVNGGYIYAVEGGFQ